MHRMFGFALIALFGCGSVGIFLLALNLVEFEVRRVTTDQQVYVPTAKSGALNLVATR